MTALLVSGPSGETVHPGTPKTSFGGVVNAAHNRDVTVEAACARKVEVAGADH